MTAARIALVLLVSACGGGSAPKPAKPASGSASQVDGADDCRPAYAEYELRWRIARTQDLADFKPEEIEEMVAEEVKTLPALDEVQKLRLMYAAVAVFIPDAAWVVAFTAAERAIATCGENARRPT